MDPLGMTRNEEGTEFDSRKQAAVEARARRQSQDALYVAIHLGMLILLITVTVLVVGRISDLPTDPAFVLAWNKRHMSDHYFQVAKTLIRPLVIESIQKSSRQIPDSVSTSGTIETWSRDSLDPDTGSTELGNGVWFAGGMVDVRLSNGETTHLSWTMYFVAETATPLFCKVGDIESGNLTEALKLAQVKTSIGDTGQ